MDEIRRRPSSLACPTPEQGERAVAAARLMFQRSLAAWVSDLLVLRRDAARRPIWRAAPASESWRAAA